MIVQPGDLVKVNVIIGDVEDELFARVIGVHEDHMEIQYYEETYTTHDGERAYVLESEVNIVVQENICEHYPNLSAKNFFQKNIFNS